MNNNSDFEEKLRSSGLRPTKQRIQICEILFNRNTTFHFTIKDLAKDTEGIWINFPHEVWWESNGEALE